jgi:membrane fusion protein (multidrug efflux system)
MTQNEEVKTPKSAEEKRKFFFKVLAISSSSLLAIFLLYYFFIGSRHVSTDNAYVGAEMAQITSAVSGIIKQVNAADTQLVSSGDVLVIIDDVDAKLELANAKANLAKAEASLKQAKSTYKRRKSLDKIDSVSEEELTNAKNDLEAAEASVEGAKASLNQAQLNLERTIVHAPISGVVSLRQVQLGQRVQPGSPLMSITPKEEMHVDANFKEVQLKKVRIGQPAKVTSDLYGSGVVYHGKVVGFSGGTGAAFAVIPAQNATGNWIKVVQRVPVRIELLPEELRKHPLQIGLSMHVDIDVSESEND